MPNGIWVDKKIYNGDINELQRRMDGIEQTMGRFEQALGRLNEDVVKLRGDFYEVRAMLSNIEDKMVAWTFRTNKRITVLGVISGFILGVVIAFLSRKFEHVLAIIKLLLGG